VIPPVIKTHHSHRPTHNMWKLLAIHTLNKAINVNQHHAAPPIDNETYPIRNENHIIFSTSRGTGKRSPITRRIPTHRTAVRLLLRAWSPTGGAPVNSSIETRTFLSDKRSGVRIGYLSGIYRVSAADRSARDILIIYGIFVLYGTRPSLVRLIPGVRQNEWV